MSTHPRINLAAAINILRAVDRTGLLSKHAIDVDARVANFLNEAQRAVIEPSITVGKWTLTQMGQGGIWIGNGGDRAGEGMQTSEAKLGAAIAEFYRENF